MNKLKRMLSYFTQGEKILWCVSVTAITVSFLIFDRSNYLTLAASLIGASSLIFCAKGNPIGQVLMAIFGTLYAIISYSYAYYGEMLTYMGMTVPMAIIALISWLKNPFHGKRSEVTVNRIRPREIPLMLVLTAEVTLICYFALRAFGTANLLPSTVSVATSFAAVYLCFRRSPFFALAYAINDIVLIVLWILATVTDPSYISVIICFATFLVNDSYSFINWLRMQKRQAAQS